MKKHPEDIRITFPHSEPETDEKPIGQTATPDKPEKERSKVARNVSDVITGDILFNDKLKRLYPYLLYAIFLVFLYIAHNFRYQRLQREEIAQKIALQEERSRSVIFLSMRMNASRHSYILRQIKQRGIDLTESTRPPYKIE